MNRICIRRFNYDAERFRSGPSFVTGDRADQCRKTKGVVVISGAGGGTETLRQFLAAIRPGSGLALLLMQHTPPYHATFFHDMLSARASRQLLPAQDGMGVCPEWQDLLPPPPRGQAAPLANGLPRSRGIVVGVCGTEACSDDSGGFTSGSAGRVAKNLAATSTRWRHTSRNCQKWRPAGPVREPERLD